tara:strand:- start:217 stop:426 length:210 start_codon:yes stop_codon:yes gene_type:complete
MNNKLLLTALFATVSLNAQASLKSEVTLADINATEMSQRATMLGLSANATLADINAAEMRQRATMLGLL